MTDRKMLSKHRKLTKSKSACDDANKNHSIVSMFARQRSYSRLPNVVPVDGPCTTNENLNLSEATDQRWMGSSKLSLSSRRKRTHAANTVIDISGDFDNNNDMDGILDSCCTASLSAGKLSGSADDLQHNVLSEASLMSAGSGTVYPSMPASCSHWQSIDNSSGCTASKQVLDKLSSHPDIPSNSDDNARLEASPEKQTDDDAVAARVPYYLENFSRVLDVVFNDAFYAELFNDEDLLALQSFKNLNEDGKKLYVRLFLRKHRWIPASQIIYNDIAPDLLSILDHIVSSSLIVDEHQLGSVKDAVSCLPAAELKALAKSLHINCSALKKHNVADAVVKHSQQPNVSNFFACSSDATEKMILQRAKKVLGRCYCLETRQRAVFTRAMMLFGLHLTATDDENIGQQQIFQMLMSDIGRVKYPKYTISRQTKMFLDRDALFRFVDAVEVLSEVQLKIEHKEYQSALQQYSTAKTQADHLLSDPAVLQRDGSLPQHLRPFTAGAIYVRILTYGVEVLQFLKRYTEAVNQLRQLLDQHVYQLEYRGRWYDRLALNLDFHMKQPMQALEVIKMALADSYVRSGRRYSLLQRAKKICHSASVRKSSRSHDLWHDFVDDYMIDVHEPRSVTIEGRLLHHTVPGATPLYVGQESSVSNSEEVTVITRVEDVALQHYAKIGYPQGLHREGTTPRTLFTLLFWDVIFADGIDDVFHSHFQTFPLDIFTDNFYVSRRDMIEKRLEWINEASEQELCEMITGTWDRHKDTMCVGIDWELFQDLEQALGLVKCIGNIVMACIMRRIVEDHRYVTGGFPDLTVWNPDTRIFKIVEVKGPGDRLSTKQILWLDYLTRLGVSAEVCYVKAVTSRI